MNEDEFPQLDPSSVDSGFTRAEKLGFAGLVILFIIIIYLGFSQFSRNLKSPFSAFIAKYSGGGEVALPATDEAAVMEEAKNKDTDKDGLSDYDELYIFRTSPYLTDTDSDGIPDKQEIEQGSDPNCPQGKVCAGSALISAEATVTPSNTLEPPVSNIPSADQLLLQSLFGNNPNPKALREFLLKQGMDKKVLDKLSDAELEAAFKQTVNATSTASAAGAVSDTTDLSKITPSDLRKLLLKQGVSEEKLKKVSDENLMKVLQDILSNPLMYDQKTNQ